MAKRRASEAIEEPVSPLLARIRHCRELIWNGNMAAMSRDLGVSHTALFRVISGEQAPSGKLLEALAKWPGLNVRWLFAGEGEPLSERGLGWGGGHFCPIARELLPGDPGQHPELLTHTSLPVATAFYSANGYWFGVPKAHPILKDGKGKVTVGDYMLIDTSADWTRRPAAYTNRLCVFRGAYLPTPIFAVVEVDDYDVDQAFRMKPLWPHGTAAFSPNIDNPRPQSGPRPGDREPFKFFRDDLVGVCRQLCRLDPEMKQ